MGLGMSYMGCWEHRVSNAVDVNVDFDVDVDMGFWEHRFLGTWDVPDIYSSLEK